MVTIILEAITAVFKSIPFFDKWFTKTPEQKLEDIKKDLRGSVDDFHKDGRPK